MDGDSLAAIAAWRENLKKQSVNHYLAEKTGQV